MGKAKAAAQASGDAMTMARVKTLDLGLTNTEMPLNAYNVYWDFVKDQNFKTRMALDAAYKKLVEFRIANEEALHLNLGCLRHEENQLWQSGVLQNLKTGAHKEDSAVDAVVVKRTLRSNEGNFSRVFAKVGLLIGSRRNPVDWFFWIIRFNVRPPRLRLFATCKSRENFFKKPR